MDKDHQKEVRESLYTSLKELGLSDLEIELYTISLTLGPSPITEIAKYLGISRPNVYKIIKELEIHGLTKFSNNNKYSRHFMVEPPTVILEKIRAKKESMHQLDHQIVSSLPDLLALYQQGDKNTSIKILQGKEQYLKALNLLIDEAGKEIAFLGSADDFLDFFEDIEVENIWQKKRIQRKIFNRTLITEGEKTLQIKASSPEQLRETRILKTDSPFVTSFQLFANKMIIWQPKAPLAVLIEDQYITAMFKVIFDSLWEISQTKNVLAICHHGKNRSKYLAKYLSEKGYNTEYAGTHANIENMLTQEKIDKADIIIFVQKILQLDNNLDFNNKRIIALEVDDRTADLDGDAWIDYQNKFVYPELKKQIDKYLPFL
ncbi:MAG: helix-turn-helix domain-containing protein [Candidatus Buchananbacteria bacterium]